MKSVEEFFLIIIGADIFITINIAYIDKGIIVKSRRKIFINYIKGQAIVDLVKKYKLDYIPVILCDSCRQLSNRK